MKKILWSVFLLTAAIFTSCSLDDNSQFASAGNGKLIVNFSIQDPTSGMATRAAIAPEAGEENIKTDKKAVAEEKKSNKKSAASAEKKTVEKEE